MRAAHLRSQNVIVSCVNDPGLITLLCMCLQSAQTSKSEWDNSIKVKQWVSIDVHFLFFIVIVQ